MSSKCIAKRKARCIDDETSTIDRSLIKRRLVGSLEGALIDVIEDICQKRTGESCNLDTQQYKSVTDELVAFVETRVDDVVGIIERASEQVLSKQLSRERAFIERVIGLYRGALKDDCADNYRVEIESLNPHGLFRDDWCVESDSKDGARQMYPADVRFSAKFFHMEEEFITIDHRQTYEWSSGGWFSDLSNKLVVKIPGYKKKDVLDVTHLRFITATVSVIDELAERVYGRKLSNVLLNSWQCDAYEIICPGRKRRRSSSHASELKISTRSSY